MRLRERNTVDREVLSGRLAAARANVEYISVAIYPDTFWPSRR
jgi:hypothetical protein